ncbi:LamG-like jellyroll fold domain-containing protein [Virgisporangium aliadipatigenens]|uniref:LamG-like jellyroll fold domain-containing protein n=1 Tax=Virgisporangium aliadipatigenens TaxID=741659 RepID=UPI001940C251|nr:LamG-like jellyroll fold domain-containing protein [Virgisporangium aliadipatigenens]
MNRYLAVVLGSVAALALTGPVHATSSQQLNFSMDATPSGQSDAGHWTAGCLPDAAVPEDAACVSVAGRGDVVRTERKNGTTTSPAIKFPMKGRAVLVVPHTPRLNPGTADFTVSAIVRLERSQVTTGANVVQKGNYDNPVGQWKLQLDRGVPSCRIAGMRNGHLVGLLVKWPRSIAGSGWQTVTCARRGDVFSIQVGTGAPAVVHNASMDIANQYPVTIGAKSTGVHNDQFRGSVDEVTFQIG